MKFKVIMILASAFFASLASAEEPARPPDQTQCVDVQIGEDRTAYLACLNELFQRRVRQEHQMPQIEAPLSARSSPNQVGGYNETSAREQMGNAFGVSPVPQRPPKPVFVNPLLPPKPH
jgi:hypothetical protein